MGQVRKAYVEVAGRDEEGINVMVRSAVVKLVASFVVVVAAMRCCGETVDATVWCGDHSGFNVVDAIVTRFVVAPGEAHRT